MTFALTVNGITYSDTGYVGKGMADGAWRTNWMPMLRDAIIDFAAKQAAAQAALDQANAAAATAAQAASTVVTGPGSTATSATNLTVGIGVVNLAVQPGKTLPVGAPVGIALVPAPRNAMYGTVDSYNSATGALQVFVKNILLETDGVFPSGTAWAVFLCGAPGVSGVVNEMKGASIASAATVNLDDATGNYLHLTGNVTTSAMTLKAGAEREFVTDGNPMLVHGPNFLLPGGANIYCQPGDIVVVRGEGGGVTRLVRLTRASGRALKGGFTNMEVITSTRNWTPPTPDVVVAKFTVVNGGYGGGTTTNSSPNGSPGADAGISVVPVSYGVNYLCQVGSGGAGNAAGTSGPGSAGGVSSVSASGFTTITPATAALKRPGGPPLVPSNGTGAASGDSLLAPVTPYGYTPTAYGASGAPVSSGFASLAGKAGVIIVEY